MTVQKYIEEILAAEGDVAIDLWYNAVTSHPKAANEILEEVVDHLANNTFL